jgi:endonuclease/exonuclease/phosphatase family metal-dependent hydrolase
MWWGFLMPASLQFLREQDADIVLLQEVINGTDPHYNDTYQMLETLRRELQYPYDSFGAATIDQFEAGDMETGQAVLSNLPIVASDVQHFFGTLSKRDPYDASQFPFVPRSLQHVAVDVNGTELNLVNFQGVWDLNGDNDSPERRRMVNTIIESVEGKSHVIVAGDTNAKASNPAMKSLEGQLTSVFGPELTTTFNMRRKTNPGYATAAVDHMYVSPDMTVIEKSCPDVDVSDHRPLVVTLEITEEKES